MLLALGIGVMKTQKEKRLAAEEEEARASGRERVAEAAANALEGFGIVTLASLFPVFFLANILFLGIMTLASLMPVLYLYAIYLCKNFICNILLLSCFMQMHWRASES